MKDFKALVAEHFKLQEEAISDTMSSKDVPEWDSMNYLLFIAAVEKEYDVSLNMDEILGAQTLGDIKRMLRSRSVNV
jgi:acyl carrier protein